MSWIKKIILYTCIILLITSLYNDINKESSLPKRTPSLKEIQQNTNFPVIKIKTTEGDTVLSVSEKINGKKLEQIKMADVINDFKKANPQTNPFQLKPNTYYLFPIY